MSSGRTLFIGGSQDGYRKTWPVSPSSPITRVHAWQPPPDKAAVDMLLYGNTAIGITTCDYELVRLAGKDGAIYTVAVESHIKDPLVALIKGYHYHRHPKRRYPHL